MSASLIGRLGSSAIRLPTTTEFDVARGLALLFGIGTKALVWGFLGQEVLTGVHPFLRLGAVLMTIRVSPLSGAGLIAPQPCIR
jgi:hypothetical protein